RAGPVRADRVREVAPRQQCGRGTSGAVQRDAPDQREMRNVIARAFVFSCVSWLMAAGLSAQAPRTVEKGDQSNIDAPRQVVIRDAAEWRKLWQQHAPDRPVPNVDFSKESVAAVFMGNRSTAGYNIAIISTTDANGALIVKYMETAPPRG